MNWQFLQGNWIDLIIIVIVLYFVVESWRVGFLMIFADFLAFLLSLISALISYGFVASVLKANFSLTPSLANAVGFLFTAILAEAIFNFIFDRLLRKIPYKYWKSKWNNVLAILPSSGEALVLISFLLTLMMSIPLSPVIKSDVSDSKIGGFLVRQTSGFEATLNDVFGGVVEDSLTFLTVKPESKESIPIPVNQKNLTVDEESENAMFSLVNTERAKRRIPTLTWDPEVVPVARDHARDMWERGYFGHISPEGDSVADRLDKAGISYNLAGENLALAPTLDTAHQGLMNSEGHRANILEPRFKKIGIGVIDNGIYGKMFVQVFTD